MVLWLPVFRDGGQDEEKPWFLRGSWGRLVERLSIEFPRPFLFVEFPLPRRFGRRGRDGFHHTQEFLPTRHHPLALTYVPRVSRHLLA